MAVNYTINIGAGLVDFRMNKDLRVALVITSYLIPVKVADDQMVGANLLETVTVRFHQDCLLTRNPGGDVTQDVIPMALYG
jgi:hypothetical protein